MTKAKSIGAVYIYIYKPMFTKRSWKILRELQSNQLGFCYGIKKYIVRYRRQKLYVYA